jgi:Zn finger protein HypA/HybF involved in hydrogenase expression
MKGMKHPAAFECNCGQTYFKYTKKKTASCIRCKGIGKRTNKNIRPKPIWKPVTKTKPFCPKCSSEMKRATGDVASMFSYQCTSLVCFYVC